MGREVELFHPHLVIIFINRSADIENPVLTRSKTMYIWESFSRKKNAFQREKGKYMEIFCSEPTAFSQDPRLLIRDPRLFSRNTRLFIRESGPTTFYPRPTTFYPRLFTHDPRLFTHDPRLFTHDPRLFTHVPRHSTHDPRLLASPTKAKSSSIEKVQRRALRIIYSEKDYEKLLLKAGMHTLEERRNTTCIDLISKMSDPPTQTAPSSS